ncbi:chromosome replication/partitioning protein [Borreliella lusitaniae]|uniref:chromosome replication/partitioning protein n=1 Tax=Borreliella lusitaniae TaxID=100177 RepID=UPI003AB109B8
MAKLRKVIIQNRLVKIDTSISIEERNKKEYELLKNELENRIENDIRNKICTMKILLRIKNDKLYVFGGYKNFKDFLHDFKIARSQAYKYIKIAGLLIDGTIKEINIIENGIDNILRSLIKDKKIKSIASFLAPISIRLKTQEAYDFYKKNSNFTSYLLENLYQKNKKQLIKELEKYENK